MDYLPGVVVVDTEDTSLDARNGAIASIGMVTYKGGRLRSFYRVFRPFGGARIDKAALKVNGFTLAQLNRGCDCKGGEEHCKVLEHAHSPEKVPVYVAKFMRENGCHTIAGQNPTLDIDYINAYFERYRRFNFISHRTVDMHSVAYACLARKGIKVPTDKVEGGGVTYIRNALGATTIYKLLGLPEEPRPHNGLTGAVFEFEALCRLIYKKPVLSEFKKYKLRKEIL